MRRLHYFRVDAEPATGVLLGHHDDLLLGRLDGAVGQAGSHHCSFQSNLDFAHFKTTCPASISHAILKCSRQSFIPSNGIRGFTAVNAAKPSHSGEILPCSSSRRMLSRQILAGTLHSVFCITPVNECSKQVTGLISKRSSNSNGSNDTDAPVSNSIKVIGDHWVVEHLNWAITSTTGNPVNVLPKIFA